MKDAQALMKNADDRQALLEKGLKKLAEDKVNFQKEQADAETANKKQTEALIKERAEFDVKMKAAKAMSKAMN
jgi:hypothetical protein